MNEGDPMTLNKDKTVENILKSEFPADLLLCLVRMDETVRDVEKSHAALAKNEPVPAALVENMLAAAVDTVNQFRDSWAVFDDEEKTEEKEEEVESETVQSDAD